MTNIFVQWRQFVWWTGQNAGAIQAVSSIVTAILSAAIVYATWKYVRLTNTIVSLTRSQFESDLLPKISFSKFETDKSTLIAHASIRNAGSRPFRVISLSVACFDTSTKKPLYPRMELSQYRDAIVSPTDALVFDVQFGLILKLGAPEHANAADSVNVWLIVWCCDFADYQDHTFVYRADTRDVLYFKGRIAPELLDERFATAATHAPKTRTTP